ncbi:FMN-binding protein [Candidatus Omnitrophota bacterium]
MKILKSDFVKMVVALTVVGVLSGAVLILVYNYATPKIKVNVSKETDAAIKNIFPGTIDIKKTKYEGVYQITGAEGGKGGGYAFTAEGNGYQGVIKMIVGVDTGLTTLQGMEVLESQETPGLGAEIAVSPFKDQFKGLSIKHPIEYVKNQKPTEPYQIEAITGATISSRAVVNILNKKIVELKKELKGGK